MEYPFHIALSFAGEDRLYVEHVAKYLKQSGIKVFYDLFEETSLWGKNLYDYLSEIYEKKAKFVVIFISKYYKEKLWTNHERISAQARAFKEKNEYILPARFDDTEIPGIKETIGYINIEKKSPEQFGELLIEKLSLKSEVSYLHAGITKSFNIVLDSENFLKMLCELFGPINNLILEWHSWGACDLWDTSLYKVYNKKKTINGIEYKILLWSFLDEFGSTKDSCGIFENYLGINLDLEKEYDHKFELNDQFFLNTQIDNLLGERQIPSSSAEIYFTYDPVKIN